MNRFLPIFLAASILLSILTMPLALAQNPTAPAPTLVPPTLVPTSPASVPQPANYSGIATIQNEGVLRVGVPFGEPPFAYLDEFGEVNGYEVELIRALAVQLEIEVEFVQVTGETALQDLQTGRVDALVGQQVITREAYQQVEFTTPHYLNQQSFVVMAESGYQSPADLRSQPISIVQGSLGAWAAFNLTNEEGFNYQLVDFFTQKDALDALERGEVAAMVGERDNLNRAGRQGMRYLEQPAQLDPYAIAVRRYDVNLRNALNRSLQRLKETGELNRVYGEWFNNELDFDVLVFAYDNLFDDGRGVAQFNTDLPIPQRSLVERVRNGETINVAGLSLRGDATTYERLLDPLNQAIMDEIGRRIGASFNYMPNSALNGADLMASGGADIALGVTPRWDGADRFDYSRPYAVMGDRLMVLEGSRYQSFGDFRGGSYMGFWFEDVDDRQRIEDIAEAVRVNTTVYEFRSIDEIVDQFNNRNVDGIFGDMRRLLAIQDLSAASGLPWQIIEDETYSRTPISIALPRNDLEFRLLIDWALQDMFLDGTYQQIYTQTYEAGPLTMIVHPGSGAWVLGGG